MGWAAYFLIGFVLIPLVCDEQGGVIGRVFMTITAWPLVLFICALKAIR